MQATIAATKERHAAPNEHASPCSLPAPGFTSTKDVRLAVLTSLRPVLTLLPLSQNAMDYTWAGQAGRGGASAVRNMFAPGHGDRPFMTVSMHTHNHIHQHMPTAAMLQNSCRVSRLSVEAHTMQRSSSAAVAAAATATCKNMV